MKSPPVCDESCDLLKASPSQPVSPQLTLRRKLESGFAHWLQGHFPSLYRGMWTMLTDKNSVASWSPLRVPLRQARVALITTGGVHRKADLPFHVNLSTGDASYRVIPGDTKIEELMVTHVFYDHTDVDIDMEVMFPLQLLREMATEERIGSVAPRHYGLNGSMQDVSPLVERFAPEIAQQLKADAVDVAILTPG